MAEDAILKFVGSILGAVGNFILYIFTEIELFGIRIIDILMIFISFTILVAVLKVII